MSQNPLSNRVPRQARALPVATFEKRLDYWTDWFNSLSLTDERHQKMMLELRNSKHLTVSALLSRGTLNDIINLVELLSVESNLGPFTVVQLARANTFKLQAPTLVLTACKEELQRDSLFLDEVRIIQPALVNTFCRQALDDLHTSVLKQQSMHERINKAHDCNKEIHHALAKISPTLLPAISTHPTSFDFFDANLRTKLIRLLHQNMHGLLNWPSMHRTQLFKELETLAVLT